MSPGTEATAEHSRSNNRYFIGKYWANYLEETN